MAVRAPLAIPVCLAAALAAALAPARARAQEGGMVVNASPGFMPGPYTTLAADPRDPMRVVVGTVDGHVVLSHDGGQTARDSRPLFTRRFGVYAIRGGGRNSWYSRGSVTHRAIRLFISLAHQGIQTARWAIWMSLDDPMTDVSDIALAPDGGRMLVAAPGGIWLSDLGHGTWTRTLGQPSPRGMAVYGLSVAIDPGDPKHALAGTASGLMVSTDGGFTWAHHTDRKVSTEVVSRLFWNPDDPNQVLATAGEVVYQSEDRGVTFAPAFSAAGEVTHVALGADGAYIASTAGLYVAGPTGEISRRLQDQVVVGVVPLGDGAALVATDTRLVLLGPDGQTQLLMRTTDSDPFMRLAGTPTLAWALTRSGVFRVGAPEARRRARRPPRLKLSGAEVERAVMSHQGLPLNTQLADRWYAKLLPRISVTAGGTLDRSQRVLFDGTFPIGVRHASATSAAYVPDVVVWAHWDLSRFVFGDANVSNPNMLIEREVRGARDAILAEVRWRYREAENLTYLLRSPPADPHLELLWRLRLEELSSYLEAMGGRELLDPRETEEP